MPDNVLAPAHFEKMSKEDVFYDPRTPEQKAVWEEMQQQERAQPMDEAALRALVKELVRKELESLDERIDKRIDAALRRSVLALRPQVRNMEYK